MPAAPAPICDRGHAGGGSPGQPLPDRGVRRPVGLTRRNATVTVAPVPSGPHRGRRVAAGHGCAGRDLGRAFRTPQTEEASIKSLLAALLTAAFAVSPALAQGTAQAEKKDEKKEAKKDEKKEEKKDEKKPRPKGGC